MCVCVSVCYMLVTKCDRQTPSEARHKNRWARSAQMFQYTIILFELYCPDRKTVPCPKSKNSFSLGLILLSQDPSASRHPPT